MGSDLHRILRSLCYNSEWKYAVFWKLKHRARMVLTWEDGYYDNCGHPDPSENKVATKMLEKLHDENYMHDPLGLAVAKMLYHVYSLGEGIVGQVAVTGNHCWITVDTHLTSSAFLEYCDGWKAQLSAGIKTILVLSVVPHGVIQLGSLNKVKEDALLVSQIRNVFLTLQESSPEHILKPIQSSTKSSLSVPDEHAERMITKGIPNCSKIDNEAITKETADAGLVQFSCLEKLSDSKFNYSLLGIQGKRAVEVVDKLERIELSTIGDDQSAKLVNSNMNVNNLKHTKSPGMKVYDGNSYKVEASGFKDMGTGPKNNVDMLPNDSSVDVVRDFCPNEEVMVDFPCFPSDSLDTTVCEATLEGLDFHQNGVLHASEPIEMKLPKDMEKLEFQTGWSDMDPSCTSLKFPVGCELHEALGPAFLRKVNRFDWKKEKSEDGISLEIPKKMSSSHLTSGLHTQHLLEAVVANVCKIDSNLENEVSYSKPARFLLTVERDQESSSHTTSNFIGEDTQHSLSSSGVCGIMHQKSLPSPSQSLEAYSEPLKCNNKRARSGENFRPRPKDRQLIQDRIKELRELLPNGSKCSIDSLLDRTIKHMLFLQSVTKHADKLNKCKIMKKESGMPASTRDEQGSSWAVEVGGHLKVCSIIVENLDKNGQMLVEMMCEACSHFLEIAEVIRSLGLTILKGVTEAHGEKTWISFVVEGQFNRNLHRMDILWSLVQILQPEDAKP